jgi:hypothetical protein
MWRFGIKPSPQIKDHSPKHRGNANFQKDFVGIMGTLAWAQPQMARNAKTGYSQSGDKK